MNLLILCLLTVASLTVYVIASQRRINPKVTAVVCLSMLVGLSAGAQTYSGVTTDTSVLTTGITTVFNTALGIGLGIIVVGLLISAVMKGIRGNKKSVGAIALIGAGLALSAMNASAQAYNGITTDTSVLTTGITTVFNSALGIGLGMIVVGLLISAVMKGIRGNKKRVG